MFPNFASVELLSHLFHLAISAANGTLEDLEKLHSLIADSPEAQLRLFETASRRLRLPCGGCLNSSNIWSSGRLPRSGPQRGVGFSFSMNARTACLVTKATNCLSVSLHNLCSQQ
ncbi:hypothetical protein C8R43DRAFT_677919 [Mycena crocata]|nr:hypothetical protein C8R43DRAFT_677919 [Mycena crocata]